MNVKKKHVLTARILAALMMSILTVSMRCLAAYPASAMDTYSAMSWADGKISMDVQYGYDNTAKGGRYIPVEVLLKSSGTEAFSGQIQVLSMESDYDIYRYDYPVELDVGGEDIINMDIPLGNSGDQLFIRLVDDEGSLVLYRRIKMNLNPEIPELFIGVLSDTPEKLEYLNGVGVDYSALRTRTFALNEENFPEKEISLDLLDVILISNYRIRDLSAAQSQALIEWVRGGGTMILGTGARVDDTLGRFAPELLSESYDSPEIRQIDMGQDYSADGPGEAVLEIPCADFSMTGANIIFSDGPLSLVSSVTYSQGIIAAAAYDFVDIEEFCERNPSYIDALLTNILGENKLTRLASESYSGNSDQYWSANDTINTGNVDRLPNVAMYTVEIVIYIILVGPGIYVFLKERKLRRYYRMGIVTLSLLFTLLIYLMGSTTRFEDAFYTYARFIDTTEDSVNEYTYLNMQTPSNKPFKLTLSPEYSVKPITRSYYDSVSERPGFTGAESVKIAIQYQEEATSISVQNVSAFEPKYFMLNRMQANEEQIGFTGELLMDHGKLKGSITNSFQIPVQDATVVLYDKMILLGDMEPGETRVVDDMEVLEYPLDHPNQVAEKITGVDRYSKPDIKDKEYMNALTKTNLLIEYLDNTEVTYTPNARIVAVSSVEESNTLQLSSKDVEGKTVLSSVLPVYSSEEQMIYRSALMKKPTIISGNYYSSNNTLYGVDPLVLEYYLGEDIEVETLYFDYVSETFTDTMKPKTLTRFEGSIYFYNYATGEFDKMDPGRLVYDKEELKPYLSEENAIIIRYIYNNTAEYSWDILLPMLNVTGREF